MNTVLALLVTIIVVVLLFTLLYAFIHNCILIGSSAPHPKAKLVNDSNLIYIMTADGTPQNTGMTFEQASSISLQPNEFFSYKTKSLKDDNDIKYRPYSINFYSFRYEADGSTIKNVFKVGSLTDNSTFSRYNLDMTACEMISHIKNIIPNLSNKTPCNFKVIFAPRYLYVNMLIQSKCIEYCNLKLFDLELYLQQVVFSYLQTKSTNLVKESDSAKKKEDNPNFCYATQPKTKTENAEMYVDTTFTREQFVDISNELITLLEEKIKHIIANNNTIPSFVRECFEYNADGITNDRILAYMNLRFTGRFKEYWKCATKTVKAINRINNASKNAIENDDPNNADIDSSDSDDTDVDMNLNEADDNTQLDYSVLIDGYDKVLRIIYKVCDIPEVLTKISIIPQIDMKLIKNVMKQPNKDFEQSAIDSIKNRKTDIIIELVNGIDNERYRSFVSYVNTHNRLPRSIDSSIVDTLTTLLNTHYKHIISDNNAYGEIVFNTMKGMPMYIEFAKYYTGKNEEYIKHKFLKQVLNKIGNQVKCELTSTQVKNIITAFKK